MTDRFKRMMESLRVNKYPLCVEMFRLANESLDQTGGEPMLLRRSKLHAHLLDNITIFIEPDDLLSASRATPSTPTWWRPWARAWARTSGCGPS